MGEAVTNRNILKIKPFGNTLVLMTMTGKQVMEVLNYGAIVKTGHGVSFRFPGFGGLRKMVRLKI